MVIIRRVNSPGAAARAAEPAPENVNDDDENARAARALEGSPFLNTKQAAHYFGVSVKTLLRHRRAGSGPRFRRHCRHVQYHVDDLDAWSRRFRETGHDS